MDECNCSYVFAEREPRDGGIRKHIDASKEGKDEEKSSFVCGRKESFVEPLTIGALRELRRINGNDLYLDITA